MTGHDVIRLGVPKGPAIGAALRLHRANPTTAHERITNVLAAPAAYRDDSNDLVRSLAREIIHTQQARLLDEPAPFSTYGRDLIDDAAVQQMEGAMRLPGALAGALMPDAHVGYGLPIGGVMALEAERLPDGSLRGHISPYAVGVDIGCSMHLTVFATRPDRFDHQALQDALLENTRFGKGSAFEDRQENHPLLDLGVWSEERFLKSNPTLRDTARAQLGSSGGGNHFASFCTHTGWDKIERLALLTHSGSRGLGARIADHYSKLAMRVRSHLPKDVRHLAWLDLDSEEGSSYWTLMQLAGDYASANHRTIHHRIRMSLGLDVLDQIHNMHNFAWLETITTPAGETRSALVHRKGATPAWKGRQGIIPGSMATPAHVVRGKGDTVSLQSTSHGSGRVMSRRKAKETFAGRDLHAEMRAKGITLIGGALDEAPEAYKRVQDVMTHQKNLVQREATLMPMVVRMAAD